jgi:hypothetical protein
MKAIILAILGILLLIANVNAYEKAQANHLFHNIETQLLGDYKLTAAIYGEKKSPIGIIPETIIELYLTEEGDLVVNDRARGHEFLFKILSNGTIKMVHTDDHGSVLISIVGTVVKNKIVFKDSEQKKFQGDAIQVLTKERRANQKALRRSIKINSGINIKRTDSFNNLTYSFNMEKKTFSAELSITRPEENNRVLFSYKSVFTLEK